MHLNQELAEKDTVIEGLTAELEDKEKEVANLRALLIEKSRILEALAVDLRQLSGTAGAHI